MSDWGGLQQDDGSRPDSSSSSAEEGLECQVCGETFPVMAQLTRHVEENHSDVPKERSEYLKVTCVGCDRAQFYHTDEPGEHRDNVEYQENREHPVHIECECGEVIKTG